jgi:hypothetical protein
MLRKSGMQSLPNKIDLFLIVGRTERRPFFGREGRLGSGCAGGWEVFANFAVLCGAGCNLSILMDSQAFKSTSYL